MPPQSPRFPPPPAASASWALLLKLGALVCLGLLCSAPLNARADVGGKGVTALLPGAHVAYSLKERRFGVGGRLQAILYNSGRSPGTLEARYTYYWGEAPVHDAALNLAMFRGDGRDGYAIYGGPALGIFTRVTDETGADVGVEVGGSGAIIFHPAPGPYAFLMGRFSLKQGLDLSVGLGLHTYLDIGFVR